MKHRASHLLLVATIALCALEASGTDEPPSKTECLMTPRIASISAPSQGFFRIADDELGGEPCRPLADGDWTRADAGDTTAFVHADGPQGSGLFFEIWLGFANPDAELESDAVPTRGVCLDVSMVGWRTLREFSRDPLPRLADLDEDGTLEWILWGSFPIIWPANGLDFGLVAWAYEIEPDGRAVLDLALSRSLGAEIADAYDAVDEPRLADHRRDAARALRDFASGRCALPAAAYEPVDFPD